jgi:hypothetical protein
MHMVVYFANQAIPDSKDHIPNIDSTLFGDILCISRIGDARPTQLLVVTHGASHKLMATCLQRETPLSSIYVVSTQVHRIYPTIFS